MKKPLLPAGRLAVLRGLWRLWHNQCPACNSDAPLVDTCKVCSHAYGRFGLQRWTREQYPPCLMSKGLWFHNWTLTVQDVAEEKPKRPLFLQ